MNIRTYALPVLAAVGMVAAVYTVHTSDRDLAAAPPSAAPAPSPFERQIAGAGIIEACSENVAVGAAVSGLIVGVAVHEGQRVQRGDLLLRVDARALEAEQGQRRAELAIAQAEVARLRALPRAEDLPPLEARIAMARVSLEDARAKLALAEAVSDKRALSGEELVRRQFAVRGAEAEVAAAEADLSKQRAGAWSADVALAEARVASARAANERIEVEIERLSVRAPIGGTCLQVRARTGEFAVAGSSVPLVLLGDLSVLHVRIDIDESDAWRFRPGAGAQGFVRGNSRLATPLTFVRVDPYVMPKRSLTGDTLERIDTRVLQVIYSFAADALPVYVGQQMDVFIDSPSDRGKQ
ncbi:MAG: biotin/lipoyl-binding protein [Planctomycetes bacterium]|nr:biotin/lipoyl-binding protein [Planctomycetota bacterium]